MRLQDQAKLEPNVLTSLFFFSSSGSQACLCSLQSCAKENHVAFTSAGYCVCVCAMFFFCNSESLESLPVPNHAKMLACHDGSRVRGVIVTVKSGSGEHDFLSRYFAPWNGIPEDPVTGRRMHGNTCVYFNSNNTCAAKSRCLLVWPIVRILPIWWFSWWRRECGFSPSTACIPENTVVEKSTISFM